MYDAIVLAGGAGRRLGGVDKASVDIAGTTLLDRVLAAVSTAERRIVVGPPRPLTNGVLLTREEPPGGGPVAALHAGLALVEAPVIVVLACDLPFLDAASVDALLAALDRSDQRAGPDAAYPDGVALVDAGGRRQPLAASYRTSALRAALAALPEVAGTPVHAALEPLIMLEVAAPAGAAEDCDTWTAVERARAIATRQHREDV